MLGRLGLHVSSWMEARTKHDLLGYLGGMSMHLVVCILS